MDSPDWYYGAEDYDGYIRAPFDIVFVQTGSRVGYRWQTLRWQTVNDGVPIPCEVNWLDPEPERESRDYAKYIAELNEIEQKLDFYRGFHQPPTEEEYNRLIR